MSNSSPTSELVDLLNKAPASLGLSAAQISQLAEYLVSQNVGFIQVEGTQAGTKFEDTFASAFSTLSGVSFILVGKNEKNEDVSLPIEYNLFTTLDQKTLASSLRFAKEASSSSEASDEHPQEHFLQKNVMYRLPYGFPSVDFVVFMTNRVVCFQVSTDTLTQHKARGTNLLYFRRSTFTDCHRAQNNLLQRKKSHLLKKR
jgi:hypothetical protein